MSKSRFSHLEFGDGDSRQERRDLDPLVEAGNEVSAQGFLQQADRTYRQGRFEQALRLYTRSLREDRRMVPAWVGQVRMLVELGEHEEARMWSDKALELFRNNGELLAAKAQACARLLDRRGAYACSDASLQAAGSSPFRWESRGEVLLSQEQPHAMTCFDKALTEPGADWFDRVLIGRILLFHRRFGNAFAYLKEAAAMEPSSALAWASLAVWQEHSGQQNQALESYRRVLEIDPSDRQSRIAIDRLDSPGPVEGLWDRLKGWFGR